MSAFATPALSVAPRAGQVSKERASAKWQETSGERNSKNLKQDIRGDRIPLSNFFIFPRLMATHENRSKKVGGECLAVCLSLATCHSSLIFKPDFFQVSQRLPKIEYIRARRIVMVRNAQKTGFSRMLGGHQERPHFHFPASQG